MKVDFLPIFRERRRLPSRRPDAAPGKILRPTSSRGGKKKIVRVYQREQRV